MQPGAWAAWFPAWCHPARGRLRSLLLLPAPGWGQTSPPSHAASATPAGSLRWSIAHSCAPIPAAAPRQLFQALGAPWHSLRPTTYLPRPCGLAQWWRSHPSHLWSYLHLQGGAEQPQGSVPTFPSTVLGDCIFGIKSELYLHPRRHGLWSWLS